MAQTTNLVSIICDNMEFSPDELVQRKLHYAIVDEVLGADWRCP